MLFCTPPWMLRQYASISLFTAQTALPIVLCTVHASSQFRSISCSRASSICMDGLIAHSQKQWTSVDGPSTGAHRNLPAQGTPCELSRIASSRSLKLGASTCIVIHCSAWCPQDLKSKFCSAVIFWYSWKVALSSKMVPQGCFFIGNILNRRLNSACHTARCASTWWAGSWWATLWCGLWFWARFWWGLWCLARFWWGLWSLLWRGSSCRRSRELDWRINMTPQPALTSRSWELDWGPLPQPALAGASLLSHRELDWGPILHPQPVLSGAWLVWRPSSRGQMPWSFHGSAHLSTCSTLCHWRFLTHGETSATGRKPSFPVFAQCTYSYLP